MRIFDHFAWWRTIAPVERTGNPARDEAAVSAAKRAVLDKARRWSEARRITPDLALDVIELGGILTGQPMQASGEIEAQDHGRLAFEAGRRHMACQLLSLMNITPFDLNILTETHHA